MFICCLVLVILFVLLLISCYCLYKLLFTNDNKLLFTDSDNNKFIGGDIYFLQIPLKPIDKSTKQEIKNEMYRKYKLNTSFNTKGEYVDIILNYLDNLIDDAKIINDIRNNEIITRYTQKKDIYASNFYAGNRNITYEITHKPIKFDDIKINSSINDIKAIDIISNSIEDNDLYESILIAFNVRKHKLSYIKHKPTGEIMDIIVNKIEVDNEKQTNNEYTIIHLNKSLLFKPTYQIASYRTNNKEDNLKDEQKYNINNFHNEYKKYVYAFRGEEVNYNYIFRKFIAPPDLYSINTHNTLSGYGVYLTDLFIASLYS